MEIGVAVPPLDDTQRFAARVRAVEEAGAASLWTYDHGRGAEAFARAGFLASVTSKVRICGGILNPFTRHPAVLASGAATVDRLSGGRFTLVMGVGWRPWVEKILGVPRRRPFSDFRDSIRIVKRLLRGETVTARASAFALQNARLWAVAPVQRDLPIYVAGGGRRGLEIAAAEADGFLTDFGRADPRYIAWMREHVAAARPANAAPLRILLALSLRIADDLDAVLPEIKRGIAWNLSTTGRDPYAEIVGLDPDLVERVRRTIGIEELIAAGRDPLEDLDPAREDAAARVIPDETARDLARHSGLVGTAAECAGRLRELQSAGADAVMLHVSERFDDAVPAISWLVDAVTP